MKKLAALILTTALAACGGGGGGGGGDPDDGPPPQACASGVIHVQLFGDSTQVGSMGNGAFAAEPPPTLLQAELDAHYGAGRVLVTSRAVSGTSAVELLEGKDGLNAPWPGSVSGHIVVINHGINDLAHLEEISLYEQTLDALAKSPAVTIFETPNVVTQGDTKPYADAMKRVAQRHGIRVADVYTYTAPLTHLLADWAHPTQDLYRLIVSSVLFPAVAAKVDEIGCGR